MLYQLRSMLEAFLTDTTNKWYFTGMQSLVHDKRSSLSKAFLTKSAHVGPLARVYSAGRGEIALFTEDFLAYIADERVFPAIHAFINGGSSLHIAALLAG